MGRIIVLLLLVAAVYLVWRAFGPQSWKRATLFDAPQEPIIKGPDDDEEFLWIIIRMTQNRQQVTRIRPGLTPPTRRKTPAGVGKIA